jgi:acetyltransferase AlgX (SGNH hydrolase-like protein)
VDRGTQRQALVVAAPLLLWTSAAWLARRDSAAAISATDPAFALALVASYAAGCALHVLRAGEAARTALLRVLLASGVLLASLGLLETPALLGRLDYRRLLDEATGNWRGPASEYQLDYERAFRRRGNVHIVGRPQGDIAARYNLPIRSPRPLEFTFNARGFRGKGELERAEVALLGDSFVEGWYVSDGETCAERLAARIGRPVANLGQSGYGVGQELRVLERDALPLQPRLVVWFFYEGNDLYDDERFDDTLAYLAEAQGTPDEVARRLGYGRSRFREASFTLNAFAALRRGLDPLIPNGMPYHGVFRDAQRGEVTLYFQADGIGDVGAFEERRLGKAFAALREGKRLLDARGIALLVAYVPAKFRVYGEHTAFKPDSPCRGWRPSDLPQRVARACAQSGLPFLDLTAAFQQQAAAGQLLYVPQDTHWDRGAHEQVAALLETRYRALGP